MLLVGYKKNLTLWLLFTQIAFFTFLTFYSACYNKVTTMRLLCDFLVLKPWTSFGKDRSTLSFNNPFNFGEKEHVNELFSDLITLSLTTIAIVLSIAFLFMLTATYHL